MRNTKLWLAPCLGLLVCCGLARSQEIGVDAAKAQQRAKELLEQGRELYKAKDFAAALQLFLESGRLGNVVAQRNLGVMYEAGKGSYEDWTESARWRKLAANQKDPIDLAALARAYVFGIGLPQNRAKAVDLYEKAADLGDKNAARWAKHYRDPTSVSFRSEEERRMFGPLPTFIPKDPVGRTFRNSDDRLVYLKGELRAGDYQMAQAQYVAKMYGSGGWVEQKRAYDQNKQWSLPQKPTPPAKPPTIYRFTVGVVCWIDAQHLPKINILDEVWAELAWWNRICIGLVGTANPQPPKQIPNIRSFCQGKQYRTVMWGELYVEIDPATDRVIECRLTDEVLDPGWTPPFDRAKVPIGDAMALAVPAMRDPNYYPGELSPVSKIYKRKRHPNSVITVSKDEQLVADGLIKFRAGAHTDEVGIRDAGSPFHVPWMWNEIVVTYTGQGKFYVHTRGAIFPSHSWYVCGEYVGTTPQADVQLKDKNTIPAFTTGAPATMPQPADDSLPGTRVFPHRYTLGAIGEQQTFGPLQNVRPR
jgi:hypothetical protein